MLAEKKALPLWRRRRPNILALERAIAERGQPERHTETEHAVIERKIARDRFAVSKGRIHPPS